MLKKSAAARLRAGIPGRPPTDAEKRRKGDGREDPHAAAAGPEREDIARVAEDRTGRCGGGMRVAQFLVENFAAADGAPRHDRQHDRASHLEAVLQSVRGGDSPIAGQHRVRERHEQRDDQGIHFRETEGAGEDFRHAEVDPAHDDDVDDESQVGGAKGAEEGGRFAGVTQLGELDVGDDFRPAPQPREKENGQHPGGQHRPPQPVSGDAVFHDHLGDRQRRVGGERRRDHRRAGQPPRHRPTRDEVVEHRSPRAPDERAGRADRQHEIAGDDQEIDRR